MLLQTSAESETRTLTIVGAVVTLCALAVATFLWINPFGGKTADQMSLAIDTPYVVQGVVPGTAVVMHGVEVGKVTGITSLATGGVRLDADLQQTSTAGLTDSMQIDFRPANYFGVTGINITPSAGGQMLRDGMHINKVPTGNFTLQALLTRLGALSTGVITPRLVSVVDRATRYTDALDPMIETTLTVANSLSQIQTVPTARLLSNVTGMSVVFPALLTAVTNLGDHVSHADHNWMHKGLGDNTEEEWNKTFGIPTIENVAYGIFGLAGSLLKSHPAELLPLINGLTPLIDTAAPLLRPDGVGQMLVELRTRFEELYGGTPEQRALRVRIQLDSLPGVAAPLGVLGAPQ